MSTQVECHVQNTSVINFRSQVISFRFWGISINIRYLQGRTQAYHEIHPCFTHTQCTRPKCNSGDCSQCTYTMTEICNMRLVCRISFLQYHSSNQKFQILENLGFQIFRMNKIKRRLFSRFWQLNYLKKKLKINLSNLLYHPAS